MRILEYTGLDTSAVASSYAKVTKAIAAGDFRAAQVKKLANVAHGKFYRARLDDANRLLFALVRAPGGVCALMLEVIAHHAYEQSRFLRGATVDEALIPDLLPEEAEREAIDSGRLPYWPGMFLVPLGYLLFIGLPLNVQGTSWWNGVKGRYFNRKSA